MFSPFEKADPAGKPASAPNRRGEGFYFAFSPARRDIFRMVQTRRGRVGLLIATIVLVIFIGVASLHHENIFLLLAVLCVGAVVVYDVAARRAWEKAIAEQFQILARNHDRLVREVARNRGDVAVIKEGLGDATGAVRGMGQNYAPARSVESRMLDSLLEHLGKIAQAPRSRTDDAEPGQETAPQGDPLDEILKLEVAPPAKTPHTPSALESALSPNFDKFSDTVVLELIRHAVRNDHLDVFVQPVVSLPQRKMRMYEVFARLRANAGAYIPAGRYLELAQKESLVSVIDNLLLLRCLQILRDRRNDPVDVPYVLNITSLTLNDTGFMNDLVTFLAQYRALASRLVFELPLEDVEGGNKIVTDLLDGLSRLGCRFSADQVRKRRIDIALLKARHIRFLKLDAEWLLREAAQPDGTASVRRLKQQLDRAGLDLIVEKIEKEQQLRELLEFGIDFGQGYLFGKPDLHSVYKSLEKTAS